MTIRSLINFAESMKTGAGINVRLIDNDMVEISYCILKRNEDVVAIAGHRTGISTPAELIASLKPLLPQGCRVHVNIEGKGILHKEFDPAKYSADIHNLAADLFPMVKPEEFFLQKYTGNTIGFLGLMRMEGLALINEIKEQFLVTSMSLGPFIISGVLPFLPAGGVAVKGYSLGVTDNEIKSVRIEDNESVPAELRIGEDLLPSAVLLAYASSFCSIFGVAHLSTSPLPWLEEKNQSFMLMRNLYSAGRIAIAFVLVSLLINALVFFWLDEKTQVLSAESELFSGKTREKNKRQKQLTNLVQEYEKIGWSENIIPLYYADQIAKSVIREIQLTSLEIGTLNAELLKKERRSYYQADLIKVMGIADNPASLNKWLNEIGKLHWIKAITDQQYQTDTRTGNGLFEFYIEVK